MAVYKIVSIWVGIWIMNNAWVSTSLYVPDIYSFLLFSLPLSVLPSFLYIYWAPVLCGDLFQAPWSHQWKDTVIANLCLCWVGRGSERELGEGKELDDTECRWKGKERKLPRFSVPLCRFSLHKVISLCFTQASARWVFLGRSSPTTLVPLLSFPVLPWGPPLTWKEQDDLVMWIYIISPLVYCLSPSKHQHEIWPLFRSLLYSCHLEMSVGFPGGASGKEPSSQCRRCKRYGFDPWVRKMAWSRKWQPLPVFSPGESHGQKSLEGYNPWGHKESDKTEWLTLWSSTRERLNKYSLVQWMLPYSISLPLTPCWVPDVYSPCWLIL